METKLYLIAQLPPSPDVKDVKPLLLTYIPESQIGTFSYGDQPLHLAYTKKETVINNTNFNGVTKANTQPMAYEISCSQWVNYFSDWPIETEQLYCASGKLDDESDTARQERYFSGFKFDNAIGVWNCTWERRIRQEVFNSTFYYSTQVDLALNLIDGVGHYADYEYADTSS